MRCVPTEYLYSSRPSRWSSRSASVRNLCGGAGSARKRGKRFEFDTCFKINVRVYCTLQFCRVLIPLLDCIACLRQHLTFGRRIASPCDFAEAVETQHIVFVKLFVSTKIVMLFLISSLFLCEAFVARRVVVMIKCVGVALMNIQLFNVRSLDSLFKIMWLVLLWHWSMRLSWYALVTKPYVRNLQTTQLITHLLTKMASNCSFHFCAICFY